MFTFICFFFLHISIESSKSIFSLSYKINSNQHLFLTKPQMHNSQLSCDVLSCPLRFTNMDRVELYLNGFNFATATADRNHTVFYANHTFRSAADLFESCLDVMEPNLEIQLESVRNKMQDPAPWCILANDD
jgi:hypothetical protein